MEGVPPKAVAAYIEAFFPNTGIGLYNNFVHVDTRGYAVRWKDKGNNTVKSFGLGKIYEKYRAKSPQQSGNEGKEEEEMTQEQFDKMLDDYFKRRAEEAPGKWSEEDRKWAEENGIVRGDDGGNKQYRSFVTKEEAVVMLHRVADVVEKKEISADANK